MRDPQYKREEAGPEIIIQSPPLGELQDIGKYFKRGEALLVCLLQSWDIVAHGMKPDGSKAQELGSLSQNLGNDKGTGKRTETLSLWR